MIWKVIFVVIEKFEYLIDLKYIGFCVLFVKIKVFFILNFCFLERELLGVIDVIIVNILFLILDNIFIFRLNFL